MTRSFPAFFLFWSRIGALGFGGPAGQIALMHREVVGRAKLLGEQDYLRALNFCMLLPGPEAQQLSVWCGWRERGLLGGLVAGLMFIIPGALVIALLTSLYFTWSHLSIVAALFSGIQAAVLAIVAQALWRIYHRALHGPLAVALAVAAFIALFFFHAPYPLVVVIAAAIGALRHHPPAQQAPPPERGLWMRSLRTALLWLCIWFAPILLSALLLGWDHRLTEIGTFFARMALVTFGGAYAALAYVAQEAVRDFHWLTATQMIDGLGLAETTPGPLILVFQFVGGLAGAGMEGFSPTTGLWLGMAMALWASFAPSFLWIFTFVPQLEAIAAQPRLAGAMAAITAAVVGVMANLALWFALHVLFGKLTEKTMGPLMLLIPQSLPNLATLGIALGSGWFLLRTRFGLAGALGFGVVAALALHYARLALAI